jgi:hypothetical protein
VHAPDVIHNSELLLVDVPIAIVDDSSMKFATIGMAKPLGNFSVEERYSRRASYVKL